MEKVAARPGNIREAMTAQAPMKKRGQPRELTKGGFICDGEEMTAQCLNLKGGPYML